MADRIFINKDSEKYSEKELNRIDWSQVRTGMLEARKAANAGKTLNPFGMVTGLLDTKLAQYAPEIGTMDEMNNDMNQQPMQNDDQGRIEAIAGAINNGDPIEPEDAQFGMEHAEEIAAAAGMAPEDVHNALQDFAGMDHNMPGHDVPGPEAGMDDMSMHDIAASTKASRTAKKKLPASLAQFQFKKKDGDNPEKAESKDDDKDSDEAENDGDAEADDKKAERKAQKFVFTKPEQLSAAALNAAREAGNEALVRATLAARAERRIAVGKMAAEETLEQLTREAKTKRRQATRQAEKTPEVHANVKTDKNNNLDFVKPTDLNKNQKSVFASKARELGFPEQYIQSMIGTRTAKTLTEADVRIIAEGEGNYRAKAERVASMMREAHLDEANRSRIIKYWVEELGYPSDYIQKLVEDYKE